MGMGSLTSSFYKTYSVRLWCLEFPRSRGPRALADHYYPRKVLFLDMYFTKCIFSHKTWGMGFPPAPPPARSPIKKDFERKQMEFATSSNKNRQETDWKFRFAQNKTGNSWIIRYPPVSNLWTLNAAKALKFRDKRAVCHLNKQGYINLSKANPSTCHASSYVGWTLPLAFCVRDFHLHERIWRRINTIIAFNELLYFFEQVKGHCF